MRIIKPLLRAIILVFVLSISYSCKTLDVVDISGSEKVKSKSASWVFKQMEQAILPYETINVKRVTVDIDNGEKKQSIRANFQIKRDSLIHLSAAKATIPIGKLEVSQDSATFVNYLEKYYSQENIDMLVDHFGFDVNYSILQGILTNQFFISKSEASNYYCTVSDGFYRLSSMKDRKYRKVQAKDQKKDRYLSKQGQNTLLHHELYIDPVQFVVKKVRIDDPFSESEICYEVKEYQRAGDKLFPSVIEMSISGKSSMSITLKYSKVEVDQPLEFKFKISSKYENRSLVK